MEKLKQWVCDVCGEIIEKPEDAYVVWNEREPDFKSFDYRIIHCGRPRIREDGQKIGCDNDHISYPCSAAISDFLGDSGLVKLLSMLDAGKMHRPEYQEQIKDIREFLEFFRRVQLPYYEEARLYWNEARSDGYFADANEVWIYLPTTLKELIEKYRT